MSILSLIYVAVCVLLLPLQVTAQETVVLDILKQVQQTTGISTLIDMHKYDRPIRAGMESETFNFSVAGGLAAKYGHPFCPGMMRDNWICTGETYEKVLRQTRPFNIAKYGMQSFKANVTLILAVGNSHLSELLKYWVCASNATVYCVDKQCLEENSIVAMAGRMVLVSISNDHKRESESFLKSFLRKMKNVSVCPHIFIEGLINNYVSVADKGISQEVSRFRVLRENCPKSVVIPLYASHVGKGCTADFQQCSEESKNHRSHQCMPGPLHLSLEHLVSNMLYERLFVDIGDDLRESPVHYSKFSSPP